MNTNMNTNMTNTIQFRRIPIHVATTAAALAAVAGLAVGAIITDGDDLVAVDSNRPAPAAAPAPEATAGRTALEDQLRLREIVATMPAGWPATEAMRDLASRPLGDAEARDRWERDAGRMPAGWPATEALRRAAADTDD